MAISTGRPQGKIRRSAERVECHLCNKTGVKSWYQRHLKTHKKTKAWVPLLTVEVDAKKGIYCSAKTSCGPMTPIHVTKGQTTECQNEWCRRARQTAVRGGNIAFECEHGRSVPFSIPAIQLSYQLLSLEKMQKENIITQRQAEKVYELLASANNAGTRLVIEIPPSECAVARHRHFSIHTSEKPRY